MEFDQNLLYKKLNLTTAVTMKNIAIARLHSSRQQRIGSMCQFFYPVVNSIPTGRGAR